MELGPNDSAISVGLDRALLHPEPPTMHETERTLTDEQQVARDRESEESFHQASTDGIVVDNPLRDEFDGDDGYESDSAPSVSTSMSSSALNYEFENGRRYHSFREGRYYFPNDDSEQEREDLKHAMMMQLLRERYYFAPIGDNPHHILDLGTGTGIWAMEMGDKHPGAEIRGIDLSAIQPEWVPPNVKFVVDDFESEWLYHESLFDYIHTRHIVMAVRDWDLLFTQAFKHLRPGGWIECQEILHLPQCSDNSMPADWSIVEYWNMITEALAQSNVNFSSAPLLAQKMKDAGFTNVTQKMVNIPIGRWARNPILKRVGMFWLAVLQDGTSAIALRPLTRMGWSMERIETWLVDVRNAYKDESVHAFMPLYLTQGQKPFNGLKADSTWDDSSSSGQQANEVVPQDPLQQAAAHDSQATSSSVSQEPAAATASLPSRSSSPPNMSQDHDGRRPETDAEAGPSSS